MKRSKLLFVIAIVAILAVMFVACDDGSGQTPHEHSYGGWTITQQPTLDATGTATKECSSCDDVQTETVAKLSDASVWTVNPQQSSTHESAGFAVYTSKYGVVTLTFPRGEHVYGAWSIIADPTDTEKGKAMRECACGHFESVEIAALSDATVWTKDEESSVAASHSAPGKDVFTSEYGTVEVVIAQQPHEYGTIAHDNGDGTHYYACTGNGCTEKKYAAHVFDQKNTDAAYLVTPASCGQQAVYAYSCVCGLKDPDTEHTFTFGAAGRHNYVFVEVETEATCTEKGSVKVRCTQCGDESTQEIAALGHDFHGDCIPYEYNNGIGASEDEPGYDGSEYHVVKCTRCGAVDSANKEAHEFGDPTYELVEYTAGWHFVRVKTTCDKCGYTNKNDDAFKGYVEQTDYWTFVESHEADYTSEGWVKYVYKSTGVEYTFKTADKLTAPYANKTYSVYEVYVKDGVYGPNSTYNRNCSIMFDANGVGTGTVYPLKGTNTVSIADALTGKIEYKQVLDGKTSTYDGYIDFESGIFFRTESGSYDNLLMFVPNDFAVNYSSLGGSNWFNAMTIAYSADCSLGEMHHFTVAVYDEVIYFGAKFVDEAGNDVAAEDCYNANYVRFVKGTETIVAFAKNAEGALIETDGKEGTYTTTSSVTFKLDGIGGLIFNGTTAGTYALIDGSENVYHVYLLDGEGNATEYYQLTLGEDYACTAVKPMATLTFTTAYGSADNMDVNVNIPANLPELVQEAYVLKGWTLEGTDTPVKTFTATESTSYNFTAVWGAKCVVTVVGLKTEDVATYGTLYKGVGDDIISSLPDYDTDHLYLSEFKIFAGWYVDANDNGLADEGEEANETVIVREGDTAITIVAKWDDLPAYYGSYTGYEIYGFSNSSYTMYSLNIDEYGNITGEKTGKISSYDPKTQTVVWKAEGSTTDSKFYFDAEAKIILGLYNSNGDIGTDFYFFSQNLGSTGKISALYSLYTYKNASDSTGYYARFIQAPTALGSDTIVFTYGNVIYSDVVVKDVFGNVLAVDEDSANAIAKATTLVVYDDDKIVYTLAAAEGCTFSNSKSSSNMTRPLDSYFGTYTCEGKDNLTFDGVGKFVWGESSGTYSVANASTNTFDLYVVIDGKNAEYHSVVLDTVEKTYTASKPMVTVSYSVGEGHTEQASEDRNINISYVLPVLADTATEKFMGWYLTDATQLITKYVPTTDITLNAKWAQLRTLTVVYGEGIATETINYGDGSVTAPVKPPITNGKMFDHWYLSDDEGATEKAVYTPSAITENTTIYCAWVAAPIFYLKDYKVVYYTLYGVNTNYQSTVLSIDDKGNGVYGGTSTSAPFKPNSNISIYYVDRDANTLIIREDYSYTESGWGGSTTNEGTNYFWAKVDPNSGAIFRSYSSKSSEAAALSDLASAKTFGSSVYVLIPTTETISDSDLSSACFDIDGKGVKLLQYTIGENTSRVYLHGTDAYFGVTFTDMTGNAVETKNASTAETLYVKDAESNIIAMFGYDSANKKMTQLDGYQGTYTTSDSKTVTFNGVNTITIDGNSGTYSLASEGAGYTFDVYISESGVTVYYNVTVDKEANTCEIVKPMVTVTYDTNGVTPNETLADTVSVNKNVEFTLPILTNDTMVHRGWYVLGDETQTIVTTATLSADATYVAKWDAKVTLTIVYGNGIENSVYAFGANDALDMSTYAPAYTNGKAFDHWYTSSDGGDTEDAVFNSTTITESITIYCAWVEKGPYTIEDTSKYSSQAFTYDAETGIWTSGNKGLSNSQSSFKITAVATITVTFQYYCESESATRWDWLSIKKNGTQIYSDGGNKSGVVTFSETVTVVLNAGETLEFVYAKDGSSNTGLDSAQIKDLQIDGVPVVSIG